jgi:hypothetical protein
MLCVNADFNKTEAIQDLIINLEMLALEALLRSALTHNVYD